MKREDIQGLQFGDWHVLKYAGNKKWTCQCSCGVTKDVSAYSLKNGTSLNCGNKTKHSNAIDKKFIDISNQQFGVLTAVEYIGQSKWRCKCVCGADVILLSKNIRMHKHEYCKHLNKKVNVDRIVEHRTARNLVGQKFGDLEAIEKINYDRYICRCLCGLKKEVRTYSLLNPKSTNSYKCKHKVHIGQVFGELTVVDNEDEQNYICQCSCGNTTRVWVGNLLNGSTKSCGCIKGAKLYTKDEIIELINKYITENKEKPFSSDLSNILNIGMTTVYEYIDEYELKQYINTYYSSKAERDIHKYITEIYSGNIIIHDRKTIVPQELDIYIPDKHLAIEFNGSYWHSDIYKDKYYHQQKTISCAKQKIRLIQIFEYEWSNESTKNKIKSLLKRELVGNDKIEYARKLKIEQCSNNDVKDFINKYHLQGYVPASINIVLKSNDEIVAAMTFGKPRFNSAYDYELLRLCYRDNLGIVGGAQRMLKYFIDTYKPKSIVTYCDISKFTGNSYIGLGFSTNNKCITEPNYVWVNYENNIVKRYDSMKYKLVKHGLGTQDQTEDEIMRVNKYYKIYDCGNIRLEIKYNNLNTLEV